VGATTTLRARNWATGSDNAIHRDDVAARLGFGGGLVPGVGLFAYLVAPAVEVFGPGWLGHGRLSARFLRPVYDGEPVTAELVDGGEVRLVDAQGVVRVTGRAGTEPEPAPLPDDQPVPAPPPPPPPQRVPAADVDWTPGTALGAVGWTFSAKRRADHLARLGQGPLPWLPEGTAHPGHLLELGNEVIVANVALGPWIHTGSDISLHAPVVEGQRLEARAMVVGCAERRGNRHIDLDVVVLADGAPALSGRHSAIYLLAERTP
jgi:acyl dehydratase